MERNRSNLIWFVVTALGLAFITSCGPPRTSETSKNPFVDRIDPFAGLPPLEESSETTFVFPTAPGPPPSSAPQEILAFPPKPAQAPVQPGVPLAAPKPLEVILFSPEGDVADVHAVSVTFNQQMVPLTSQREMRPKSVPMIISPLPAGRFRWIDTRTLTFESEDRFPYATRYQVTVPAGTRSQSGRTLKKAIRFSFSTPRPEIVRFWPNTYRRGASRDTAIALELNQRVDPKQLLSLLRIGPLSGRHVRVVPPARWSSMPGIGSDIEHWSRQRTVVIQPKRPLEPGKKYRVVIKPGLVGEGPRQTTTRLLQVFETHGPLKVKEIRHRESYFPGFELIVEFNNPLVDEDPSRFIRLSPRPTEAKISHRHDSISLIGLFKPDTTYTITVYSGLRDIFGQKLQKTTTRTIRTGDLSESLHVPGRNMISIERSGSRVIPLELRNVRQLHVHMKKMAPDEYFKFKGIPRHLKSTGKCGRGSAQWISGPGLHHEVLSSKRRNALTRLSLDVDKVLGPRGGGPLNINLCYENPSRSHWRAFGGQGLVAQVTDITILSQADNFQIAAWVGETRSGRSLVNARVLLRDPEGKIVWRGKTDAQGMARAPGHAKLPVTKHPDGGYLLWAHAPGGNDFAFVEPYSYDGYEDEGYLRSHYSYYRDSPRRFYTPHSEWIKRSTKRRLVYFLTDRSPYRPGETVHLKGVLRDVDIRPSGGVEMPTPSPQEVTVRIISPRSRMIFNSTVDMSSGGTFALDAALPKDADLGRYAVCFPGGCDSNAFQVQAYRAKEFSTRIDVEQAPRLWGDRIDAWVSADYLFGAPMASAACEWKLTRHRAWYQPPDNEGFSFGEQERWWMNESEEQGASVASGEGRLDLQGRLRVDRVELTPKRNSKLHTPLYFELAATVTDQNRQSVSTSRRFTVHPAKVYVGLKSASQVIRAGSTLAVEAVLTDLEGKRIGGKKLTIEALQIKTAKLPASEKGDRFKQTERRVGLCRVTTGKEPRSCSVRLPAAGTYLLRAATTDDAKRPTRTSIRVYASGPGYVQWESKADSQIELVPDKKMYKPGDTARVLIKSPFRRARGFVSLLRNGIDHIERLTTSSSAHLLSVPIKSYYLPEIYVYVALRRDRPGQGNSTKRVVDLEDSALARGYVRLPVSTERRRIRISITPDRRKMSPAEDVQIQLRTTDHRGKPVRAEVALMLVDEGVLSLQGYSISDPVESFYQHRFPSSRLVDLRDTLIFPRTDSFSSTELFDAEEARRKQIVYLKPPEQSVQVTEEDDFQAWESAAGTGSARARGRTRFLTTAYFNPAIMTDDRGQARVTVTMPDNVTTYRIMAMAVDRDRPDRFGRGESSVTVSSPLLLRAALPRFLSLGDRFQAAVMVHNETDRRQLVDVLVRGDYVSLIGSNRKQIELPARQGREVSFAMKARRPGTARIQFAAVMERHADAIESRVPVSLPVTSETLSIHGMVDSSVAIPLVPPADALAGFGELTISLASTALGGLEDAARYLGTYPYGCSEQLTSQLMAFKRLGFIFSGWGKDRFEKQQQSALHKLIASQNHDGGWGLWPADSASNPAISAYVAHALWRAMSSGMSVPLIHLKKAIGYLRSFIDEFYADKLGMAHAIISQASIIKLFSAMKQDPSLRLKELDVTKHLRQLYRRRHELPLFARAWLMEALFRCEQRSKRVNALLRQLGGSAVKRGSTIHFVEKDAGRLRALMHSSERTDAIVLQALLQVDPDHPLIEGLVQGLLQRRTHGRWTTTQANALVLDALASYYKHMEKDALDHTAQTWYGTRYLGQQRFRGRSAKVVQLRIPLDVLREIGPQSLLLSKLGRGRLHFRIGLRYAPSDMVLPAVESGFSITREYRPAPGADSRPEQTVRKRKDNSWEIKAGATVRVRGVVVVPDQRYYVAISDRMPAGLEAVNPEFNDSESLGYTAASPEIMFPDVPGFRYTSRLNQQASASMQVKFHRPLPFDHRELRDDQVLYFVNHLSAGVYEYSYLARATSRGMFIVPPARAEEMYSPETYGHSATTFVHIQ